MYVFSLQPQCLHRFTQRNKLQSSNALYSSLPWSKCSCLLLKQLYMQYYYELTGPPTSAQHGTTPYLYLAHHILPIRLRPDQPWPHYCYWKEWHLLEKYHQNLWQDSWHPFWMIVRLVGMWSGAQLWWWREWWTRWWLGGARLWLRTSCWMIDVLPMLVDGLCGRRGNGMVGRNRWDCCRQAEAKRSCVRFDRFWSVDGWILCRYSISSSQKVLKMFYVTSYW